MHVLISDPALVKTVMIKDFTHFMDRPVRHAMDSLLIWQRIKTMSTSLYRNLAKYVSFDHML